MTKKSKKEKAAGREQHRQALRAKKMKKKAFYIVLSQKLKDGKILILDDLKLIKPKTKEADIIINKLGKIEGFEKLKYKRKNRALILTPGKNTDLTRAFNNLPGLVQNDTVLFVPAGKI